MSGQRWLVTGSNGFLGRAVMDQLSGRTEIDLIRFVRPDHPSAGKQGTIAADIDSPDDISKQLLTVQPDVVLHLAGRTPPATEQELEKANEGLTRKLLHGLAKLDKPVRFIHAGSAAELGEVPVEKLPVDETYVPKPVTPYGKSKWAAAQLVLNTGSNITPVVARIFNIIGPGQATTQAFGRYASDLLRHVGSETLELKAMGLGHKRDFIDIRDAAGALILLADIPGAKGIYNVGTGQSRAVVEGVEILIRLSGKKVQIVDSAVLQAHGPTDSRADISKITAETGWRPLITMQQSLTDFWNDLLNRQAQAFG